MIRYSVLALAVVAQLWQCRSYPSVVDAAAAATTTTPSSSFSSSSSRYGSTIVDGINLPSIDELRVTTLQEIVPAYKEYEGQMFAGQLPIDHESSTPGANPDRRRTGNLMFWLFVPDNPTAPDTMVFWTNGGPGCSSFATGNLFEHGPVTVPLHEAGWCCEEKHESLQYNEYTWAQATVMLYIEQPVGVGFSEATNGTPPPSSEDDVAADMDSFMQNFYKVFGPDSELDLSSHRFYLTGESYAGTYIPSIARGMYLRNVEAQSNNNIQRIHIPITGISVGNGVMDVITQSGSTIDWSWYHGMIDAPTRDYLHRVWDQCMSVTDPADGRIGSKKQQQAIQFDDDPDSLFHPFDMRDDCGVFIAILRAAGQDALKKFNGPNVYEYSTWDQWKSGQGDTGTIGTFYNNIEIQKALNVPDHRVGDHWRNCVPEDEGGRRHSRYHRMLQENHGDNNMWQLFNHHRELYMDDDKPWDVTPYLAQLLDEAEIDVLVYSGDRDIICNTQGAEEAIQKMEWSGNDNDGWSQATRSLWVYDDYPAGYIKSNKNLHFLTVYNAGHMVPYNQPGPALDMIERFLLGESFHDRPLLQLVPPTESIERTGAVEKSKTTTTTSSVSTIEGEGNSSRMPAVLVAILSFLLGILELVFQEISSFVVVRKEAKAINLSRRSRHNLSLHFSLNDE
eukprot:CAMPEP_0113462552 /NCGR_PEP_ID=MMETSP0014_2-20120614/12159_1 /TAXON_ID=2857 /ORGANISM="Nitzschia sp." /LENGTH=675 /DNA_ID=CAMNT_0000354435 /DNA_START=71 /DNA_END=2096 /DNA_ORIENTATION=- /assembly_acc=CAM_ASM_000159